MQGAEPLRGLDHRVARRVEEHLSEAAQASGLPRDSLGAYLSGGKRLRARLLVLCSRLGDAPDADMVGRYAAFVELVHAGGLCHDDIVDQSLQRRSCPSLGATHGNACAAMIGLYLMTRAYGLVAQEDEEVRGHVAAAAALVAKGQADEMTDLFSTHVSEEAYVERCREKTGALFVLAGRLGARVAGLSRDGTGQLIRFCAEVGLAFQLADDVRDFSGVAVLGRPGGTDVRAGVYTLPILRTVHGRFEGGAQVRDLLPRIRDGERGRGEEALRDLVALLSRNGALSSTQSDASSAIARAKVCLDGFPLPEAQALRRYAVTTLEGVSGAVSGERQAVA